jgi:RNA polymerase-interacting CarD/CdnL/TRCF family regulator
MTVFVREVLKGTEPMKAVVIAYPKAINPDVQLAKLYSNKKVQHALHVMSRQGVSEDSMRIKLIAIINNPESTTPQILAAAKMLRTFDKDESPKEQKDAARPGVDMGEVDLAKKLDDLRAKAVVN